MMKSRSMPSGRASPDLQGSESPDNQNEPRLADINWTKRAKLSTLLHVSRYAPNKCVRELQPDVNSFLCGVAGASMDNKLGHACPPSSRGPHTS